MSISRHASRYLVALGLLLALGVCVAACGGGGSSSGGSSSGSTTGGSTGSESGESSGAASAEIEKVLKEAVAPAKWEGPTEPTKAVAGKHIAVIEVTAAVEGEQRIQKGAEAAAKALGWQMTAIDGKGTPQGFEAAVTQALNEGVDGVYFSGVSPSLIPNAMKKLKAAGIPVVTNSAEDPIEELWIADVGFNPEKEGKYLAAQVTKESGGEAKVMLIEDKEFPIDNERTETFKKYLGEFCSGCEIANTTQMRATEIENELGPKIGGALQANPEVDYIFAPYDNTVPPMVAAIKQASLQDEVKIVSTGGNPTSIEYIRNGEVQSADTANVYEWMSWEAFDILNRTYNEEEIPTDAIASDPVKLITSEALPPEGESFDGSEAEYEKHYEELWGL